MNFEPPLLLLLPLLVGCGGPARVATTGGHYEVYDEAVVALAGEDHIPNPVLAQTSICPSIECTGDDCPAFDDTGGSTLADCVSTTVAGDAVDEGDGCFTVGSDGPAEWSVAPTDCVFPTGVLAEDGLTLEVVQAANVVGSLPQLGEEAVDDGYAQGIVPEEPPSDWRRGDDEPLRLIAGSAFAFFPSLGTGEDDVAWRPEDATIVAMAVSGGEPDLTYDRADTVWITVRAGDDVLLDLATPGGDIPLGEVVGVDASEADSLTIAAFTWTDPTQDPVPSTPLGARALVRDAAGNLLYGAPVEWTVDGPISATPGGDPDAPNAYTPGKDYVYLPETCDQVWDHRTTRYAGLTASFGDLQDHVGLTWSPSVEKTYEPPEGVDPQCRGSGCGCSTGSRVPPLAGLWALGFVVTRRRGR